jgi:hypothetical protein
MEQSCRVILGCDDNGEAERAALHLEAPRR